MRSSTVNSPNQTFTSVNHFTSSTVLLFSFLLKTESYSLPAKTSYYPTIHHEALHPRPHPHLGPHHPRRPHHHLVLPLSPRRELRLHWPHGRPTHLQNHLANWRRPLPRGLQNARRGQGLQPLRHRFRVQWEEAGVQAVWCYGSGALDHRWEWGAADED